MPHCSSPSHLPTSAATAHAECAWVLWTQLKKPNLPANWQQLSAHESKEKCERERAPVVQIFHESLKRAKPGPDNPGGKLVPTDNGFIDQTVDRRVRSTMTYECWPDTVDPRGPRG